MASEVAVERAAVQGGIGCCKTAIHELETASRDMKRSYQQAGSSGWKDKKYAELGGIVEECCSALTKPIADLQQCMSSLQDMLTAIDEYESESF